MAETSPNPRTGSDDDELDTTLFGPESTLRPVIRQLVTDALRALAASGNTRREDIDRTRLVACLATGISEALAGFGEASEPGARATHTQDSHAA